MPKVEWLKGIIPALVTPFTKDEEVDIEAFKRLIDFVIKDVNAIVPCGTTGEFVYLSPQEKMKLFDAAIDHVNGKVPVIAGTGCASTKETVETTQYAKDAGADACLVVSPFFFRPTFNEVYDHYEKVNDVGLPMIVYNIPQCSGTHHRWWTTEGLADMSSVIGVKDSSGDMPYMMALFEKIKGQIAILCGHDEIGMPALAAGADGLILASANLIPEIWQEMYKAVQRGDIKTAQDIQARIQKLVRIIANKGASQAVKEGLAMMGLPVGESRRPILSGGIFEREDREEVRAQLEFLGKIKRKRVELKDRHGKMIHTDYPVCPKTPPDFGDLLFRNGEAFSGPPSFEAAHIDLLLGWKDGPVGTALEEALLREKGGSDTRMKVIMDRPRILLVPTVTIRTPKQEAHMFTHAAGGIVSATQRLIEVGVIPEPLLDDIAMIANAFVHPSASNPKRIKLNNYKAMGAAVKKALEYQPTLEEVLREKASARHPFRYTP